MRAAALGVALALAAVGTFLLLERPVPVAIAPAVIVPLRPRAAGIPIADAGERPRTDAPLNFGDGFCSSTGVDRFELRFSLEKLVNDFLGKPPEGTEALAVSLTAAVRTAEPSERLRAVRRLVTDWPASVAAQAVLAIEARDDERVQALRRARRLAPRDPAIGWALASATRDSGELDEAIDGLSTYLAADDNPVVSRLRARLEVARTIQLGYERVTRNGVTVLWPAASLTNPQALQLAGTVDRELDAAAAFTGTDRRTSLTVVVYPSRSELLAVSCAQAWAAALFDGTLRLVAAPTPEGISPSALRHETLHAQLSPLAPTAPRWFHEGVAQAFERKPDPEGWLLMVRNRTWVPFTSLDGTFGVFEADADASLAYAQSYAMVELMRELGADQSISTALQAFNAGASTPTALARACRRAEVTGADLLEFLGRRIATTGR